MDETSRQRLNAEWTALNAFRDLVRIASNGDYTKATYDNALEMGGSLYPELLGADVSVLVRERECDTTKEFRQKAELMSIRQKETVKPLNLVLAEVKEFESLLEVARRNTKDKKGTDQLKRRLGQLNKAREELEPNKHTENQLIFRDAYSVQRNAPTLFGGQSFRDFVLPEGDILRIRVLHPDKPEYISGADIIYERHILDVESVSLVAIQYKIWENKTIYLSDERMMAQLGKLKSFLCDKGVCSPSNETELYRFPYCSAFLRPTDKLQRSNQAFISTGEHLPICKVDRCGSYSERAADVITYNSLREWSVSHDIFENLFNKGKIGSRPLSYQELSEIYSDISSMDARDRVVIYAQEFERSKQSQDDYDYGDPPF